MTLVTGLLSLAERVAAEIKAVRAVISAHEDATDPHPQYVGVDELDEEVSTAPYIYEHGQNGSAPRPQTERRVWWVGEAEPEQSEEWDHWLSVE